MVAGTLIGFKVKNNLVVQSGQVTLGSVPLAFNTDNNKLRIQVNGQWIDISDSNDMGFNDIDLAIDYNGAPIYSVGGDGVITEANKMADGGSPSTSSFALTFDSGTVA
ncbi:MAG: hypothetical protein EBV69_08645 [Oxalobacteraceae bacterium]|nr:hypothetical protein [Oxalobacteraceae bacterium]